MISKTFTVLNPSGFHARPTKLFVKQASLFPGSVHIMKQGKRVNGKSALSILTLGISHNDEIVLEVDGEGEEEAVRQLGQLIMQISMD